ncbi:hypothetical protein T4D_13668 [Trichinella pseudospiralis]|uniref:Uncharacterized protein n=1 Tax=Trichinella pseudospiralis TaxID=6337 RepID=A0A0V1FDS4_TRIPS|nr:hypothetical protein T4D_13668 [Trichinella pseudospiralis]
MDVTLSVLSICLKESLNCNFFALLVIARPRPKIAAENAKLSTEIQERLLKVLIYFPILISRRCHVCLRESAIEKKLNVAYLFVINLLHTIILCLRCNSTIVATSSVAIELTFYTMLHEELYFLTCNFIIVNSNNLCYLSCSGDLDIAFDFVAGYELARQEDA